MLQRQTHISSYTVLHHVVAEESREPEDGDDKLEDAARAERDYVRGRLREELQREPSEQEVDEWLRQHTEGY